MEHSRVGSGVTLPQKAKAIDIPVRDLNNMDRNSLISCINSLQLEVQHLTERLSELESENRKIRIMACEQQAEFEKEEEYIANKLLKRIDEIQQGKELDFNPPSGPLKDKINQLQKEKVELELALEQEQEYMVNRLQQQMESLKWHPPTGIASPIGTPRLSASPSSSDIYYSVSLVDSIKRDNNILRMKIMEQDQRYQREVNRFLKENDSLKSQLYILKKKLLPISNADSKADSSIVNDENENEENLRPKRANSMVSKKKADKAIIAIHQRKSIFLNNPIGSGTFCLDEQ